MSTKWYQHKLAGGLLKVIQELQQSPMSPETISGLVNSENPAKTKCFLITQVHGSLSALFLIEKVKEAKQKEEENKQ